MSKSNLDLFKQALTEGLSNRIDRAVNECDTDINYSKKHTIAMRTIVHGKIREKRAVTPKMKWIIAVTLSAIILLTGCAIKFREYIFGFIEEIYDFCVRLTYDDEETAKDRLDELYEFSYAPDGYVLTQSNLSPTVHMQVFTNEEGSTLVCDQMALEGSVFLVDNNGSSKIILSIGGYEIYYKTAKENTHCYLWNDGRYAFQIVSQTELTTEELTAMVNGVRLKQ